MPVNQPPIEDDIVLSSWQYEVTELLNRVDSILQRNRVTRGDAFPPAPELGAEHYLTTGTTGWYKFDTEDSWIFIGG